MYSSGNSSTAWEKGSRPVTQRQADCVAKSIKADGDRAYLASALTQHGLQGMMTEMLQEAITPILNAKGKVPETIVKILHPNATEATSV